MEREREKVVISSGRIAVNQISQIHRQGMACILTVPVVKMVTGLNS